MQVSELGVGRGSGEQPGAAVVPEAVWVRLRTEALRLNDLGLKGFGLLVGDPAQPEFPFRVVDAVFLDATLNRRNDAGNRAAFHAQGSYFRMYDDAGFVADPVDLLRAWRSVEERGLEPIAMFHVHRRQPANFSSIDYRLHNPTFAWHLIISLRVPANPVVRAFRVRKSSPDFGIDVADTLEGSERSYGGAEVAPLRLALADESSALHWESRTRTA